MILWQKEVCALPITDFCAKYILFYLAFRADQVGSCFPSLARIAADTGTHIMTVQRKLHWLEERQYISVERGGGRRVVNNYILTLDQDHSEPPAKSKNSETQAANCEEKQNSSAGDEGQKHELSVPKHALPVGKHELSVSKNVLKVHLTYIEPISEPTGRSGANDAAAAPPPCQEGYGGLQRLPSAEEITTEVSAADQPAEAPPSAWPPHPTVAEVDANKSVDAELIRSIRDLDHDAIVAIGAAITRQRDILDDQFAPWLRDEVGMKAFAAEKFMTYGHLLGDGIVEWDMIPPNDKRALAEHLGQEASDAA